MVSRNKKKEEKSEKKGTKPPKPESGKRSEKKPISDEDKIKWALDYYNNSSKSLKDLVDTDGRDSGTISRSIQEALKGNKKGGPLVRVYAERISDPPRLIGLEEQLTTKFDLNMCIVFDDNNFDYSSSDASDKLHKKLGYLAADAIIKNKDYIRDNDIIGFSSGRSTYYTVQEIYKRRKIDAKKVTLVSLVGNHRVRDHSDKEFASMDADILVELISPIFKDSMVKQVREPICIEETKVAQVLSKSYFCKNKVKMDICIAGCGVLTQGHNWYKEIATLNSMSDTKERKERISDSLIGPIIPELEKLVTLCEKIIRASKNEFYPVWDICNRLSLLDSFPKIQKLPQEDQNNIRESLEEIKNSNLLEIINNRLVAIKENQLKLAGKIFLIAGTKCKAYAVKECLTEYKNIKNICIDSTVANFLLEN